MNRKYFSGGRKFSERSLQCVESNAFRMAGIKKYVHVHTSHHTFATHLVEDGIDIGTIQKFMGHHNIRTTLMYIHVAQCEKKVIIICLITWKMYVKNMFSKCLLTF